MSRIKETIEKINKDCGKALNIFLTSGFPNPEDFVEISDAVIDSGADLLEIGVPFGDSLADGPIIQSSYIESLNYGIGIRETLKFVEQIRQKSSIPIILMSSSNPIYKYGLNNFMVDAENCGIDGILLPDIPFEEHIDFYSETSSKIDKILLTTPTSTEERIRKIDHLSDGFLYCVSIAGTTGKKTNFQEGIIKNIDRTYQIIENNKMLIGFGISTPEDIQKVKPHCDGVIVGTAVIKKMMNGVKLQDISSFIKELKEACI